MRLYEITQDERAFFKLKSSKDLDSELLKIYSELNDIRGLYKMLQNSKSRQKQNMIKSYIGITMNSIKDIDDFCEVMPDDMEAFDIRVKLYDIFNELEEMHNSIK
jgi:hypothetical protein